MLCFLSPQRWVAKQGSSNKWNSSSCFRVIAHGRIRVLTTFSICCLQYHFVLSNKYEFSLEPEGISLANISWVYTEESHSFCIIHSFSTASHRRFPGRDVIEVSALKWLPNMCQSRKLSTKKSLAGMDIKKHTFRTPRVGSGPQLTGIGRLHTTDDFPIDIRPKHTSDISPAVAVMIAPSIHALSAASSRFRLRKIRSVCFHSGG